jgi:hypothetical protein
MNSFQELPSRSYWYCSLNVFTHYHRDLRLQGFIEPHWNQEAHTLALCIIDHCDCLHALLTLTLFTHVLRAIFAHSLHALYSPKLRTLLTHFLALFTNQQIRRVLRPLQVFNHTAGLQRVHVPPAELNVHAEVLR